MDKIAVARSSFFAAIGLTGFKLVVGLSTGSLGIISEAIHSSLDLVAALMTLLAVKVSGKPADQEHNYGHGKFENLSALFETVLLVVTCVWIVYEAVHRLSTGRLDIEVNAWSYIVIVTAIIVDYSRSRALSRAAKKFHSQALEADALHFSSDIASSAVVLVGLVCYMVGVKTADSIAAIVVSMIVLVVSWNLGKRSVNVLLDRAPEGVREQIDRAMLDIASVQEVHDVRIRTAGPEIIIELNIHTDPGVSLQEAHRISEEVEQRIRSSVVNSHVHVHVEPSGHELAPEGDGQD